MTVTTRKYFTDWFVANGINKDWGFDFTILSQEDVIVQVRTGLDDTTIVEYTTDLGFFPADDFASGTVRYPVLGAAVPTGKYVRLVREVAYLQKEQIGKEGRFSPLTHEKAFDKLTILAQQTDNNLDRAIKVQIGGTPLELVASMPNGAVLMKQGDFIVEGPNGASINSAQGYAEAAGLSATAAAGSATAADASKVAAQLAESNINTEIMQSRVPVGSIIYVATTVIPAGYLLCDGTPVTALYPDLRALLIAAGSPFGTSGADPRLPELRGEFIRGHDGGRGIDPGRVFGSLQLDAMQAHDHELTYINTSTDAGVGGADTHVRSYSAGGLNTLTGPARGRTAAETRPRSIAMTPCIKAFGAVNPEGMANLASLLTAIATQAEAEAGLDNTKLMTPQRARQGAAAYNRRETIQLAAYNNVASLVVTNLSAFRELFITGEIVTFSSGTDVRMQLSTDNGATWITSSVYNYMPLLNVGGSVSTPANAASSALLLAPSVSITYYTSIDALLTSFNKADYTWFNSKVAGANSALQVYTGTISGITQLLAFNAFRILAGSGNIAGQLHIEGLRG